MSASQQSGSPESSGAPPHFDVRELEYDLPEDLIAQEPLAERSASRMLMVDRLAASLRDATILDLPEFLHPGDVLVLNDTRVLPAKFTLRRRSGGRIEGLFLQEIELGVWEVLLKGAGRVAIGETLEFESDHGPFTMQAVERGERGRWRLRLTGEPVPAATVLDRVGRMPLPPYIKRGRGGDARDDRDRSRYQTVYAARDGAVAAPTAGLHFTPHLLGNLEQRGVEIERVTLHVGYGTFAPLEVDDLAHHDMHSERYEISDAACQRLRAARERGGRIVAVGTTSARVLETSWAANQWGGASEGWTKLFCYPPYAFGGVDALVTNFHLPRSTLLALVMAFAGIDLIRSAYAHAIAMKYRFYSYGDAMLIV